ncbi:metal-dependent hydrolase [Halovulum dunhuangense]|uniref:Metal-dependent hydrolase n=1 Tax=Halovulum dunhuangense TaxID=1505036 RepID=A0A849L4I8_9RHOB|nr:endonuclease/exonuclease/phosphatase family protein [Halovulum dunhuangense]NNU81173.1 metal-dependent hydrolase [Halovulum dunhuangense]
MSQAPTPSLVAAAALRIASYNIRKCVGLDWRRRPARVMEVIDALGADVIALQEADRRLGPRRAALPHDMVARAGWHALPGHAAGGVSLGFHGNAILLRPEAEIEELAPLHLPALEPRGALVADIRLRGRGLRIVGVHLGLRRRDRRRQIMAIAADLALRDPRPTIIMGDFNSWGGAEDFAALGPGFAVHAPGHSFHAARPLAPLDRIVTGPGVTLTAHGVHRDGPAPRASDHLPIWADIAV